MTVIGVGLPFGKIHMRRLAKAAVSPVPRNVLRTFRRAVMATSSTIVTRNETRGKRRDMWKPQQRLKYEKEQKKEYA